MVLSTPLSYYGGYKIVKNNVHLVTQIARSCGFLVRILQSFPTDFRLKHRLGP